MTFNDYVVVIFKYINPAFAMSSLVVIKAICKY